VVRRAILSSAGVPAGILRISKNEAGIPFQLANHNAMDEAEFRPDSRQQPR
jgi:hypothetical protein